jgi:hypothetical protein
LEALQADFPVFTFLGRMNGGETMLKERLRHWVRAIAQT